MIAALAFLLVSTAHAMSVVCTLPTLGAIARRIAPDAEVTVLARGTEDPHYLSPTPALMAKVRQADLYIENGMNLELWSERLLDGAGNPDIRPGSRGYVRASDGVHRLEVPTQLTRAQGDLHPEGNPHVWLDPLNWLIIADNITAGLQRVDPAHADAYAKNAEAFKAEVLDRTFGHDLVAFMGGDLLVRLARSHKLVGFLEAKGLSDRLGGWMKAGASLRGRPVIFYHQSWAYFVDRFGLDVVGYIEDKPGISPSAAHKAELARAAKARGVQVIGVTSYYDTRLAEVLAEEIGAHVAILPGDVGGVPEATDPFALIDVLIQRLGS